MTAVRGYPSAVFLYTAHLFLFPLDLETTTAAILLYKSQILRFLNPRLLFMYWRGSVKGVAVSKPSAAALSKVSKPNVDCIVPSYFWHAEKSAKKAIDHTWPAWADLIPWTTGFALSVNFRFTSAASNVTSSPNTRWRQMNSSTWWHKLKKTTNFGATTKQVWSPIQF